MAALQAQLARYSNAANGTNPQAKAAYLAVQSALQSGNVSQAQAALAKLQELSKASSSQAPLAATASVDTDGDNDGSSGVNKTSLDATA